MVTGLSPVPGWERCGEGMGGAFRDTPSTPLLTHNGVWKGASWSPASTLKKLTSE